jgi:subtilisin family serine protease
MNDGPACDTVTGAPAVYLSTHTVGSTTSSDGMSSFSSRGYATGTNAVKPDIVAPGSSVRSAYNASDTAYTVLNGTSMASPHVAGAVALLWPARACLLHRQEETETVLNRTAWSTSAGAAGSPLRVRGQKRCAVDSEEQHDLSVTDRAYPYFTSMNQVPVSVS